MCISDYNRLVMTEFNTNELAFDSSPSLPTIDEDEPTQTSQSSEGSASPAQSISSISSMEEVVGTKEDLTHPWPHLGSFFGPVGY